jgi:hypothetical protein
MNLAETLKLRNIKASAAGAQATVPDSRSADEWIKNWLDKKNKRLNDLRQELHNLLDFPEPVEIESAYREDKKSLFEQMPGRVAGHGRWAVVSPEGEIISRWDTKEEADAAAWPAYKGIKPSATGASGGARVKKLAAGGPGSGCQGPNCGRPKSRMAELKDKYKEAGVEMPVINYTVKQKSQYIGSFNVELNTSVGQFHELIDKTDKVETAKVRFLTRYLEREKEKKAKEVQAADIFQDVELGDKTRAQFLKHPKPSIVKDADVLRIADKRPSSHGAGAAGTGGTTSGTGI